MGVGESKSTRVEESWKPEVQAPVHEEIKKEAPVHEEGKNDEEEKQDEGSEATETAGEKAPVDEENKSEEEEKQNKGSEVTQMIGEEAPVYEERKNEEEEKQDKEEAIEKQVSNEGRTEPEAKESDQAAGQTELQKPSGSPTSSPTSTEQVDPMAQSKSAAIDFANLFEEIANIIGKAATCSDEEEISDSLSMLKQLSSQSFSEITPRAWADLIPAFQVLVQATTLPSDQVSAINDFFKQFGDLCESYDSSVATSRTALLYFHTRDNNLELLKSLYKFQLMIFTSVNDIRNERGTMQRRLRELEESQSQKLEEYAAVGRKTAEVKAEWEGLMVKNAAMDDQRKKAENEKAKAEALWKSFISHFK